MNPASPTPTVLIVGGPDVDARIELMSRLRPEFNCIAAGSAPDLAQRFETAGFAYHVYPLNRGVAPAADLRSVYRLWQLCRTVRPQIVHTFDPKPSVWGRLAARAAGVPIIIGTLPGLGSLYARDSAVTRLVRTIYQPLQTWACRSSQLTIFQNSADERQFIDAGVVAERASMVMPGSGVAINIFDRAAISDEALAGARASLGIRPGELVVTMISRVIRSKGVPEFVGAARLLRARYPHLRFVLIGATDEESLDRLGPAELAELRQILTWPGPRRDIAALLAITDLFALPSAYREGIPRVLMEAAAMALPIVTTNSPGCNEVVEDETNGLLVPARDTAALVRAIARLVEQPELRQRFGRASRARAVERFDLALIAQQTRSIYRELLARGAPAPVAPA